MKLELKSLEGKVIGDITVSDDIFAREIREDIITRVVRWQLARRQQGSHKTKQRAEVSGTTKKPFRQKGTGNARQGSLKGPHQRGGGVSFGPVVRSHAFNLPKKVRQLGLKTALSSKAQDGKLIIIDKAEMSASKTKDAIKLLESAKLTNALFIDGDSVNVNFLNALSNVPQMDVLPQQGINVYDILKHDSLVLTKAAVEKLEERLK